MLLRIKADAVYMVVILVLHRIIKYKIGNIFLYTFGMPSNMHPKRSLSLQSERWKGMEKLRGYEFAADYFFK